MDVNKVPGSVVYSNGIRKMPTIAVRSSPVVVAVAASVRTLNEFVTIYLGYFAGLSRGQEGGRARSSGGRSQCA